MKYFVAILCLAQIVLSAPSEPTAVEQGAAVIANLQASATAAVSDLNQKVLSATGVQNNAELVSTIQQQGESYASEIKGLAEQVIEKASGYKPQVEELIGTIAKQISESASNLLGEQDPAKNEQIKGTFNSILEQTNTLNSRIQEEGSAAQSTFADVLKKLYDNTVEAAKKIATQLDEQAKKP